MIEVVLCRRDSKGNKVASGKKSQFFAINGEEASKMCDSHVAGKHVKKPYRADALDRFYFEGEYAPDPTN